jgi:hypothetical protein
VKLNANRHIIFTDGKDSRHVICHVLKANEVDTEKKSRVFDVEEVGDFKTLFELLGTELKVAGERAVGFVVDAEESAEKRWAQIEDRLASVGLQLPAMSDRSGGVVLQQGRRRLGFWVMPDNLSAGAVEEFLNSLISDGDKLWEPANAATDHAASIDKRFVDSHRRKAVLACWLAWQRDPGNPYGTAIAAGFLDAHRQKALEFVDWYRKLCEP